MKKVILQIIDFAGTVDGEAFSGGEGKGYPLKLVLTSLSLVLKISWLPQKGDATDVEVTFPEDYFVKELAGKEAVFKVNVQDVNAKSCLSGMTNMLQLTVNIKLLLN